MSSLYTIYIQWNGIRLLSESLSVMRKQKIQSAFTGSYLQIILRNS